MQKFLENLAGFACEQPDKVALCEGDHSLSYAELWQQSASLAAYLAEQGLEPASRVGFVRSSLFQAYVMVVACLRAGVNIVYLDARDNTEKSRHIFQHAQIDLLICEEAETVGRFSGLSCDTLQLPLQFPAPEGWQDPVLSNDLAAWIEPTSGSSGMPKLVQVSRAVLGHYLALQTEYGGLQKTDCVAVLNEMWLDVTLSGLNAGACVKLFDLRKHGAVALARWVREAQITVMQTFLAGFRAMAEAVDRPLPHLKRVKLAGEMMLQSDVEAFNRMCPSDAVLMNFYGSTELSFVTQFTYTSGDPLPAGSMPVGQPVRGTKVDLIDVHGRAVTTGERGQIRVVTPMMATGYLNNPEKSHGVYWVTEAGVRCLDTGDIGRFDSAGNLHILGRVDDQVKIRGYSVRYSEVESALKKIAGIADVCVTSIKTPHGTLQLVAHYIAQPDADVTPAQLRAALSRDCPAYLVPNHFVAHEEFPRTDTGKVLRRALPDPLALTNRNANRDVVSGASPCEREIMAVWQEILGHSQFGLQDDFFDLGGDSLQAMSMVLKIEHRLHRRVGYESLVLHGASIAQIAARICDISQSKPEKMLLLKKGDGRQAFYVLPVENGEFSDWLFVLKELEIANPVYGVHVRNPAERTRLARKGAAALAVRAAKTIQEHDPDGPYILAGYSSGTQLAIETARILQATGKTIAGLLLLDPPVARFEPYYRNWRLRRGFSPLLKQGDVSLTLNRIGHVYLGLPARELDVADEVCFWTYKPAPFSTPHLHIVFATEENPKLPEKQRFWDGIFGEAYRKTMLPANHQYILRRRNAQRLALVIKGWVRNLPDMKV